MRETRVAGAESESDRGADGLAVCVTYAGADADALSVALTHHDTFAIADPGARTHTLPRDLDCCRDHGG